MRVVLLIVAVLMLGGTARADFVLVKNAKNPTAALARPDVKAVFTGKIQTWANGDPVTLVIGSEDSPAMHWLCASLFGVSLKTYLAKIKQDVFHGDMRHPLSADDDAKTIARVQSGAGVVGWVTSAAKLPADVKMLPVK